jgi:hypothetical protein
VAACWLKSIGLGHIQAAEHHGPAARDRELDRLARHFAAHVDIAAIETLVKQNRRE